MAITTRQSSLLVAEDWTKVYQTFRDADFQSYDYETIRKSMIDYLRYIILKTSMTLQSLVSISPS